MSHDDLDGFLFVKQRVVSIDEEGDEEGIFEKISQVEEVAAPRIINTYQDTEGVYRLEGNIENLPPVLTGGRTIDSEDVVELRRIGITMVDDNEPLEDNIPYVGAPVTEGGICDGQVWVDDRIYPRKASDHHRSGTKLPSVSPSIVTNLTLLD